MKEVGGSGSCWRGITEKLAPAILKKNDRERFRKAIVAYSSAIDMLLITTNVSLAKVNDRDMLERTEMQPDQVRRRHINNWLYLAE